MGGGGDLARPAELPVCCWRIGNEKPSMFGGIPAISDEFSPNGLGRRSEPRILTLRNQCLGNLLTALSVTHESEGNRNALAGQNAVIVLVCNAPHLSQNTSGELGTVKDQNCGVAGDYTQLLGVAFLEYFVGQSNLCLGRRELAGHGVQNLQGIRGDQGGSNGDEGESLRVRANKIR